MKKEEDRSQYPEARNRGCIVYALATETDNHKLISLSKNQQ